MDANVRRERPVLGGILLAAALTVLLVLWFGRACWGGWWIADTSVTGDTYLISVIWERWATQVKDGHLPLWFPEFAGGYPVHAAWMYGLFYPPLLLVTVMPPEVAWTWLAILHIVFGALGMYALLWDERCDVTAAVTGAIVFALSGFVMGRILAGHLNLVMPLAWAPWVIRAALRVVRGEKRAVGWLVLCAGFGLLAGHVQIWFYVAPLVAAYALFEARVLGRIRVSAWPLLIAVAVIVGITSIQWLPAAELFHVSGHPAEDPAVVLGCSAPASALAAQIAPNLALQEGEFAQEYLGLGGPLAVGAAFLAFRLRDRRRWFWFAVFVLGLVLAMGTRNEVSRLVNELPPFRFARAPGRALALVVLAGSVLAANAVADFLASRVAKWRIVIPAGFAASALLLGIPAAGVVRNDFYEADWSRALPPGAAEHRVHVLSGRYPYPERSGIRTLRTVCPLDTPGWKALGKEPSAAIAWWLDLGAELEPPQWMGPPDGPASLVTFGNATKVRTFEETAGRAQAFGGSSDVDESEAQILARLRRGERSLWLPDADADPGESSRHRGSALPFRARVISVPTESPVERAFRIEPGGSDWILVSEKWYPGWVSNAGGRWRPVERGNLAFIASRTTGDELRLRYSPSWLWPALVVSLASLSVALVLLLPLRRKRIA